MKENTSIVFTCDIDWAPDFAIDDTIQFFEGLGIELTLFATHESKAIKESGLEIGIHPFLSKGSEEKYEKIISDLMQIYPEARGSRTHRNYFGYTTPQYLVNNNIKYDISVVNWLQPAFGNVHFTGLKTVTYSWEDGLHFDYDLGLSCVSIPYGNDVCIYNVHPIVIYLNQNSEEIRKKAVKGISDLTSVKERDLKPYKFNGYGIKNIIEEFVSGKPSITLRKFLNNYFD